MSKWEDRRREHKRNALIEHVIAGAIVAAFFLVWGLIVWTIANEPHAPRGVSRDDDGPDIDLDPFFFK